MQYEIGQYYHAYNRGNNKQPIFFEEDNYYYLIRLLRKNAKRFQNRVCGFKTAAGGLKPQDKKDWEVSTRSNPPPVDLDRERSFIRLNPAMPDFKRKNGQRS